MTALGSAIAKDLRDVGAAMRFELTKHIRRRRIVIALLLSVLLPLPFFVVPRALGRALPATSTLFAGNNLAFASLLILICAAFFGGDAISSELDKRTFLVSYVAPQRRTSVFAGKFLAALLATAAMTSIYFAVTIGEMSSAYGFGDVPAAYATSFGVALLYAAAAISVAFTFSSIMRSTITSNMLSFFMLLLVLPIISGVLSLAGVDPWLVPTYYASLITSVFGGATSFGGPGGGGGLSSFEPNFNTGLVVVAAWTVALLLFGALVTSRRQME